MKKTIGMIALLLGLSLSLAACKPGTDATDTSAATQASVASSEGSGEEMDQMFADAVKGKDVYLVEDIAADDSRWEKTVANCGNYKLSNREAQIHYYMQYLTLVNQGYAAMMGLDSAKPMHEQESYVSGVSWEQFFLGSGVDEFHQYAAMATMAEEAGFTLPQKDEERIQDILKNMPEDAKNYGFDSVDAFIQASFGSGVRLEDYEHFIRRYFLAMSYENSIFESVEPSDDELKAYFDAHPEEFTGMDAETKNVNVRHILIRVSTTDEMSDEEKTAAKEEARKKAESLLAEYQKNPTEDHFAELAGQNSEDPGSKDNGGLYEEVYPGQMVQTFNDWCFDAARKSGDTGIVETDYGYHVMYYVKQTDTLQWKILAKDNYAKSVLNDKIKEAKEKFPLTADYQEMIIGSLPAQPEPETTEPSEAPAESQSPEISEAPKE